MDYEITDVVKWAYQSAFGCGHLLPAFATCRSRIEQEMGATPEGDVPAFTLIGGGLCRLHLANGEVRSLGADLIARMMFLTDEFVRARPNNQAYFDRLTRDIPSEWMDAYRAQGCPPVSHSETYRAAHHPAYRVVLRELGMIVPVLARKPRMVVIDGPCGSGKTTLAHWLGKLYDTAPIPMDDFFLPPDMRTEERLCEPGGNVHRERFIAEVLEHLSPGQAVHWQRFDCQTWEMLPRSTPAAPITLIEGSYSHHPAFDAYYQKLHALRVCVDVDEAEQIRRIQKRDPEMLNLFQSRWIPLEKTYLEAYDIKRRADILLPSPVSGEERFV